MTEETRRDKTYKKGRDTRWKERQARVGRERQWEAAGPWRGEKMEMTVQLLGICMRPSVVCVYNLTCASVTHVYDLALCNVNWCCIQSCVSV